MLGSHTIANAGGGGPAQVVLQEDRLPPVAVAIGPPSQAAVTHFSGPTMLSPLTALYPPARSIALGNENKSCSADTPGTSRIRPVHSKHSRIAIPNRP